MGEIKDALKSQAAQAASLPVYYSTGCLLLDMVIGGAPGCYGIRGGVLTGIFGVNQAGKSFLCGEMIGRCYNTMPGFSWDYQDIERRFRFDTKKLYGVQIVDPDPEARVVETIEELDAHLGVWLDEHTAPAIVVVDSLDALSNEAAEEAAEERKDAWEKGTEISGDAGYGTGPAKFLAQQFFKTKMSTVARTNVALVFLSQVRENIGGMKFAPKHKRTGGTALDHWCDTTLKLKVIHKIKVNDRAVGAVVEAETTKSSTGRPFRSCRYTIYFDYGIDDIGSSLDYLYDLRSDRGELLSVANEIAWSGKPKTLSSMKDFLERHGAEDRAKRAKKAETKKSALSVSWLLEWIPGEQDLATSFAEEFGVGISGTKDELIAMIENDPEMAAELRQRVIDKWEAAEAAVAVGSTRKRKYG